MARDLEAAIHTDFSNRMDYSGYLMLDQVLTAQHPLSTPEHHDELLFIVQHQTSELWMKLMIHELEAAIHHVQEDNLEPCFKILARVKQVQRMLFEQWAVLETLTPSEYSLFRGVLGHASGLQSWQYRTIEFLFGDKDPNIIKVLSHSPDKYERLKTALERPSIYDEFIMLLGRQGFHLPASAISRDWSQPYEASAEVQAILREIYSDPHRHWAAYEMCEKLVDVDEAQALWRFRHLKTVERIIGFKVGTGGSSGVDFLQKAADIRMFPELWNVRTEIGS